ncbi:MAG: 5-oxoprolinase subunit PxpB [Desulfarculus sp.]|nr:5-oxoprolinase subunit PxpB [Pseudomonadota bacterium]MBV1715569.1 5-oxoprolinase subunit PxpB [Desulfarculus sp.]MBU4574167.1 5-oxoprolinase subunit PxpB [Pseudomonadota bacterium]MBU4598300.1 5-oxoprolinase subunit PxpB [Pseudomonadota bacterium]MBV1739091.1 5-oxoprolinase subunit PxpB [Desulfarculus sp.]
MIYPKPLLKPSGDRALRITFGDERSLRVNQPVRALSRLIASEALPGLLEMVPTYASMTVLYDPDAIDYDELAGRLEDLARQASAQETIEASPRLLTIPVCYEGDYAPDMDYICDHTGLDQNQVVGLHTAEAYFVFQLGFTPGCPFIGPLQEQLHVPLMQSPRTRTPKGAVAISVGQTVIYPRATPGGMRIVGRTPVQLFQLEHPDLTLFKPGDRVRFRAVSVQQYQAIEARASALYDGVESLSHG